MRLTKQGCITNRAFDDHAAANQSCWENVTVQPLKSATPIARHHVLIGAAESIQRCACGRWMKRVEVRVDRERAIQQDTRA